MDKNYDYATIAKLIRAQYTSNCIQDATDKPQLTGHDSAYYAKEYFSFSPTKTDAKGRQTCCCSDLINAIFADIYAKTGVDLSDQITKRNDGTYVRHNQANLRKRLLGIKSTYTNATGKSYVPRANYQQMIVTYLECESWDQLCRDADDLLHETEGLLSDVATGACQPDIQNIVLVPKNVTAGNVLDVRFGNGKLSLLALSNCRFSVLRGTEGLFANDTVCITDRIIVGSRLVAEMVSKHGYHFSDLWLSSTPIKSFKVKDSNDRMTA